MQRFDAKKKNDPIETVQQCPQMFILVCWNLIGLLCTESCIHVDSISGTDVITDEA